MKTQLTEISNKYKLDNFLEKLSTLNKPIDLKIGFLGEFSSGKSTLINAILEKKILPSMDKPTSKSIIEIVAKDELETIEYYKIIDNQPSTISAIEFADIALTDSENKAMLKVPSNDFFQNGYRMIDTPGISSLDKSDMDITYGYLPFLDCAVICSHIQKGSLTQSIIDFLLKDEIKPIINNLLFVITNSHSKSPKAQNNIKKEIISQLQTLNKKSSLGLENIENKVIILSALEAMEQKNGYSLDSLKSSFNDIFIKRKSILLQERVEKELNIMTQELLETLSYKKEHLDFNLDELKEKEHHIEKSIDELSIKKETITKELTLLDEKINNLIRSIFFNYLPKITKIKEQEAIETLLQEMTDDIAKQVNRVVSKHFEMTNISNEKNNFSELEALLSDLLKQIDMGKDIGMVVLIELLTLGTAGIGGVFGFFLRSSSKMLMQTEDKSRLKDVAIQVSKVNPLEFIGDKIGAMLIETKLTEKFDEMSQKISKEIIEEIKEKLEEDVFELIEEKLKNHQNMLNQIYKEKSEKFEAFNQLSKELDDDILELNLMKMK